MRGSRITVCRGRDLRGSIPADAGEPATPAPPISAIAVDPRGCGGAMRLRLLSLRSCGRSPRMRGSPERLGVVGAVDGSIPADAGEPRRMPCRSSAARVDPRGCGGASPPTTSRAPSEGRSPRMRGSQAAARQDDMDDGSIPADAGEPAAAPGRRPSIGVDPRGCGGAAYRARYHADEEGRSPRMRGSLQPRALEFLGRGSIPADAGEPWRRRSQGLRQAVDPRGCGGAIRPARVSRSAGGRSPRMRGSL